MMEMTVRASTIREILHELWSTLPLSPVSPLPVPDRKVHLHTQQDVCSQSDGVECSGDGSPCRSLAKAAPLPHEVILNASNGGSPRQSAGDSVRMAISPAGIFSLDLEMHANQSFVTNDWYPAEIS